MKVGDRVFLKGLSREPNYTPWELGTVTGFVGFGVPMVEWDHGFGESHCDPVNLGVLTVLDRLAEIQE